jgi:formylglycine-generating enzyme required for sulfatase activity
MVRLRNSASSWTAVVASLGLSLIAACERKSHEAPVSANPSNANRVQTVTKATESMVFIHAGQFLMGAATESDAPVHEVSVGPFYMDKYLVTQQQYEDAMHSNPSRWKGTNNPVEQVRWSDAVRFCNARSQLEGLQPCYDLQSWKCSFDADGYRLPTEAEWEYACRAGTTTAYFFSNDPARLGEYAWFDKNAGGRPRPVGQKRPNPWGLFDMCGNVWEWCNDFYGVDYYGISPRQDPRGPDQGKTKVVRGGAWRFSAENLRSGYRYNENPGYSDVCFGYDIYGFRCVRKDTGK